MGSKRTLGVVLFEGFELLDVFGPLEMFGLAADHFEIRLISETGGVVASRQGPKSVCDDSFQSAPAIDVLLVLMLASKLDYTIFFRHLSEIPETIEPLKASFYAGSTEELDGKWASWLQRWRELLQSQGDLLSLIHI